MRIIRCTSQYICYHHPHLINTCSHGKNLWKGSKRNLKFIGTKFCHHIICTSGNGRCFFYYFFFTFCLLFLASFCSHFPNLGPTTNCLYHFIVLICLKEAFYQLFFWWMFSNFWLSVNYFTTTVDHLYSRI